MKKVEEQKGTFKKVACSDKPMYGPRALLICGYPVEERAPFLEMLDKIGLGGVPAVFATVGDLEAVVGELLVRKDKTGLRENAAMQRAVVMSGLTQKELHTLMGVYRKAGLPRQLWATLTPVSEHWSLGALLDELEAEATSLAKKGK
jgi:hypothetical protein